MARTKRIEQDPIVKIFSQRLKSFRKKRGLSQMHLALRAKITLSYAGKLERGESAPGIDMLSRIAQALGISPAELLGEVETERDSLAVVRDQIQKHCRRLVGRQDEEALNAISVVLALADNALARR